MLMLSPDAFMQVEIDNWFEHAYCSGLRERLAYKYDEALRKANALVENLSKRALAVHIQQTEDELRKANEALAEIARLPVKASVMMRDIARSALKTDLGKANATDSCVVEPYNSRMCERGTKACSVRHTAQRSK